MSDSNLEFQAPPPTAITEGKAPRATKLIPYGIGLFVVGLIVCVLGIVKILPGGIGTGLELFMVWQLLQVKHMTEHPLILVGTMWGGLIEWIDRTMVQKGLVSPTDLNIVTVVGSTEEAIPIIGASFERFKEEKANAHAGSRR